MEKRKARIGGWVRIGEQFKGQALKRYGFNGSTFCGAGYSRLASKLITDSEAGQIAAKGLYSALVTWKSAAGGAWVDYEYLESTSKPEATNSDITMSQRDRRYLACVAGIEGWMNAASPTTAVINAFDDEDLKPTSDELSLALEAVHCFKVSTSNITKERVAESLAFGPR